MLNNTDHTSAACRKPLLQLFFFMLLCSCALLSNGCGGNETEETGNEARATPVTTAPVVRGMIETRMHLTGTVEPDIETFIGPKVSGRIETFFADTGDFVKAGAPLLQLEKIRFELATHEAEAALEEARKNLVNLESTLKRNQQLFETGVLGKQTLDDTVTDAELARARAASARARAERARLDLQDATLYAPFSGFVVERRMNAGEVYSAAPNEYVFHLVDSSTVIVELDVIETKKQYLAVGQAVDVYVDALPGTKRTGTVTVVNPLVDPSSRKFLVKVSIPNESLELEPGMFARVSIPERQSIDALVVPARAVIERGGRLVAFVAENEQARERVLETGLITPEQVEVTGGLQEGETVIVGSLFAIKDGSPIRIEE